RSTGADLRRADGRTDGASRRARSGQDRRAQEEHRPAAGPAGAGRPGGAIHLQGRNDSRAEAQWGDGSVMTMRNCLGRVSASAWMATLRSTPMPAAAQSDTSVEFEKVHLTAGRSTVLTTDFDVQRIAVTNPAIADATVVQPRESLIDGKGQGTISL